MKNRPNSKRLASLLSAFLAVVLMLGVLPAQIFAVTQAEIDQLQRKKEAIEAKVEEKQAAVDELQEQQAGVMEQKAALDERNEYLFEQRSRTNSFSATARACAPWRKTAGPISSVCCSAPTRWASF